MYGLMIPTTRVRSFGKRLSLLTRKSLAEKSCGAALQTTNTPILAWDRGGYWQDPYYYPDKVKYQPVSSVPYWDERCGMKFEDAADFEPQLEAFLNNLQQFSPRNYILENLTLEHCARNYLNIYRQVEQELR